MTTFISMTSPLLYEPSTPQSLLAVEYLFVPSGANCVGKCKQRAMRPCSV